MATQVRTWTQRAVMETLKERSGRFDAGAWIERILFPQKTGEGMGDAGGRTYTLAEMRAHVERKWSN